jgi:hypothetical protein
MTKPANKKAVAPEAKKTALSLQMRDILSAAYAFVQGERYTASISSVTLETLMNEQIDQIEGSSGKSEIRPNKLDEIDKLVLETTAAVTTVKALPPSSFKLKTKDKNANTSIDGGDKVPT